MNKILLAVIAVLAMTLVTVPIIAEDDDGAICTIKFHDEFHGDFYVYTDHYGNIVDHNQFRSWPPVEGYEFKGWFYKNGEQFYTNDHFTRNTTVYAVYEEIGGNDDSLSGCIRAAIICAAVFLVLALIAYVIYVRT